MVKNPFDPFGIGEASFEFWRAMMTAPAGPMRAQLELTRELADVALRAIGPHDGGGAPAVIEPAPGDKRFTDSIWTTNPYFAALKQGYLLATKTLVDTIDATPGLDEADRRRIRFFAKQFCDAMSPTNFPLLNPQVLAEALRTGGENFRRGAENAARDLRENEGRVSLVDASGFSVGTNIATTPGKVVYRNELIELIQYAPTTPEVFARPLVIVPPWINKYYVLDLQPSNSFIKYAVDAGRTTFCISWRNPGAELRDRGISEYLREGPLTAFRVATEIAGTDDVDAVGYCIGGTILGIALAYLAQRNGSPIRTATFFATLLDFSDPGEIVAFLGDRGLATIDAKMAEQGYLSGREMADTFQMLRANDLIWSPAVNRYLLGKDAPAFDLLVWNSDVTRVPEALHRWTLHELYTANRLTQPGALSIDGVPLDLGRVQIDCYSVATLEDHIAPWRSVYAMTRLFSGETTFRLGVSGHIAGIINPPGKRNAAWRGAPAGSQPSRNPEEWLASADQHEDSWWPDWGRWLAERSPAKVPAREALGSPAYPPLCEAPGTYVLER
ncbi:MAG TPA: alpha/beta fold hydrolase [Candidatus Acidoferrum sp.]|nr:alpha/beta fold hydrolase [Candidatus Acidoferrum sp.]